MVNEYLSEVIQISKTILEDKKYNHYKNQIFARQLGAEFDFNYSEEFLWQRALILTSNSIKILFEKIDDMIGIKSLKECAEIYEYFWAKSEKYDNEYCAVLSALCYDVAGYQANALCMMRKLKDDYSLVGNENNNEISIDNFILKYLQRVISKNIPSIWNDYITSDMRKYEKYGDALLCFSKAIEYLYKDILFGDDVFPLSLEKLEDSLNAFYKKGNIHISHLLSLFRIRLLMYKHRSIWHILREEKKIVVPSDKSSVKWEKYAKLLTQDRYERLKAKPISEQVSKYELWVSQIEAIRMGLLRSETSYIIQMPTSAGKTFIAELAILDHLTKYSGKKCLYIAPFRALTNEIENEISNNLSKLGYSVSSLLGDYEIGLWDEFLVKETDVLVATPEKLDTIYRLNPEYFSNITLVIVDEGHLIGDLNSRASLLEFLLIKLKIKITNLRVLYLSAVMPQINTDEFSRWLSGSSGQSIRSPIYANENQNWQPTNKIIGILNWRGDSARIDYINQKRIDTINAYPFFPYAVHRKKYNVVNASGTVKEIIFPNDSKKEIAAALSLSLSESGSCLVFCSQPRYVKSVGESLLKLIFLSSEKYRNEFSFGQIEESDSYQTTKKWYGEEYIVTKCIKHKIGLHFGKMPSAVRKAIENDYRKGILKILVATNTIGQGLNFPIKHLLFHSINLSEENNIKHRDFWNIVGRAGRATRETNGNVVYLSTKANYKNDIKKLRKYLDFNNIEPVESIIYDILRQLCDSRTSIDTKNTLENNLHALCEPHILNLLVEEIEGTDDEKIIETLINNSLFSIQSLDAKLDISLIKKAFSNVIQKIRKETNVETQKIFSKTGLSLRSNKSISTFIDDKADTLRQLIEIDDYQGLLMHMVILFRENGLVEVTLDGDKNYSTINTESLSQISIGWLMGTSIETLLETCRHINIDRELFFDYISDALYFKYPWGITAFLVILAFKMGIQYDDLPPNVKALPTYLKYGLNNTLACLSMSLGIKTRELALVLANNYSGQESASEFISWLSNITQEDMNEWKISRYEYENIHQISLKLGSKYESISVISFEFMVKGVYFERERQILSKTIKTNDELRYERDFNNEYDPFAIFITSNGKKLGYVPKEYARIISTEIDLNRKMFQIIVKKIDRQEEYNQIFVQMNERP